MDSVVIRTNGAGKRSAAAAGGGSISPYLGLVITKTPNWGVLTAFDILLNNLAVGTYLAVVLGWLLAPSRFAPIVPWALVVALVLLGADLLLLVLDLGDTLRFHHMLPRVQAPRADVARYMGVNVVWGAAGAGSAGRLASVAWRTGVARLDWERCGMAGIDSRPGLHPLQGSTV